MPGSLEIVPQTAGQASPAPQKTSDTIIAANHDPTGTGADVVVDRGTVDARYSLVGNNRYSGLTEVPVGLPDAAGNLVGGAIHGIIDPRLAPLADNGGLTATHALLPGSPAIGAGDPAAVAGRDDVPLYDQRGEPFWRVANEDGNGDQRIDMGVFELQQPPAANVPGDFNGNGVVEQADLDLVLLHWGLLGSAALAAWVGMPSTGPIDQDELDAVLLN